MSTNAHRMARRILRGSVTAWFCAGATLGVATASAATFGSPQALSGALDGSSPTAAGASAAYDGTRDRYLVAWTAPQDLSSTVAVWARFVTPDGQPSGRSFRIAVVEAGIEGRHAGSIRLVYLPANRRYLAVFTGPRNGSYPNELEAYGQWLDDDGDAIGGTVPISRGSGGTLSELRAAADPDGTAVAVVYTATRPARPTETVFAQLVSPGAVSLPTSVFPGDSVSGAPSVTFASALGQFVVAGTSSPGAGQRSLVLASIDGLPPTTVATTPVATVGPETRVSTTLATSHEGFPRVAWTEDDGATITVRTATSSPGGTEATQVIAGGAAPTTGRASIDLALNVRGGGLLAWNVPGIGTSAVELTATGAVADSPTLVAPAAAAQLGGIDGSLGDDRTRGGWLLPWTVATPGTPRTTRQVFAGTITPALPPSPTPLAEAPKATPFVAPLCRAPLQPFATAAGAECGGVPVPSFQVSTVRRQAKGAGLLGLVLSPTAAGQGVRVSCVSRCTGRRSTLKRKGRKRSTSVPFSSWRSAPPKGAVIEARVESPGRTTRYRRFKVTSSHPYLTPAAAGCVLSTGRTASC